MGKFKRYRYHLAALLVLLSMLLMGARTRSARVTRQAEELPRVGRAFQSEQALELLVGANRHLMGAASAPDDRRQFILTYVKSHIRPKYADRAFDISRAVILEANAQKMDPFFLLAVISTESKFNISARGTHGEVGLMQVLPRTAEWLAQEADLPDDFDLEDPAINIRLGAIYLSHLRASFRRHGARYVAAYNMGSVAVRRLVAANTEPGIYPNRVLGNYADIYMSMHSIPTLASAHVNRDLASVK